MFPYIYALIGIISSHDELYLKELKTTLLLAAWTLDCLLSRPFARLLVQRATHEIRWVSRDEWESKPPLFFHKTGNLQIPILRSPPRAILADENDTKNHTLPTQLEHWVCSF